MIFVKIWARGKGDIYINPELITCISGSGDYWKIHFQDIWYEINYKDLQKVISAGNIKFVE